MKRRVKIFTHETVIHSQTAEIERILNRTIEFDIILNRGEERSNLQFNLMEDELATLKSAFGYTLLQQTDSGWVPVI